MPDITPLPPGKREHLPLFRSEAAREFLDFEPEPLEWNGITTAPTILDHIDRGELSVDDVALFDMVLMLVHRDFARAEKATARIVKPSMRQAALDVLQQWRERCCG